MIFLTALVNTAAKVRAFETGGMDYITKPFQLEEVLARVEDIRDAGAHAAHSLPPSFERLRTLEKLRDDLVHMIVHDMRTPLKVLAVSISG